MNYEEYLEGMGVNTDRQGMVVVVVEGCRGRNSALLRFHVDVMGEGFNFRSIQIYLNPISSASILNPLCRGFHPLSPHYSPPSTLLSPLFSSEYSPPQTHDPPPTTILLLFIHYFTPFTTTSLFLYISKYNRHFFFFFIYFIIYIVLLLSSVLLFYVK